MGGATEERGRGRASGSGRGEVSVRRGPANLDRHVRVVVELGAHLVRAKAKVRVRSEGAALGEPSSSASCEG